jgi:hypothetical protein
MHPRSLKDGRIAGEDLIMRRRGEEMSAYLHDECLRQDAVLSCCSDWRTGMRYDVPCCPCLVRSANDTEAWYNNAILEGWKMRTMKPRVVLFLVA